MFHRPRILSSLVLSTALLFSARAARATPANAPANPPPPESAPAEAGGLPLTGVASVATGYHHSCAVLQNGQARCWGLDSEGALGDGDNVNRSRAVSVLSPAGTPGPLTGVTQLSLGNWHSCALLQSSQVRCWGDGDSSALGDGVVGDRHRPVVVKNAAGTAPLQHVVQIESGGYNTCAVLASHQLQCWGYNSNGELGVGSTSPHNLPVTVRNASNTGPLRGVTQVSVGYSSTCVRLTSGQARCWGYNSSSQLGDDTIDDHHRPSVVRNSAGTGPLTGVRTISAGYDTSCALLVNHQVRCWGDNDYGELGDDSVDPSGLPVTVSNSAGTGALTHVMQLSTGEYGSCALLSNHGVRCWGDGDYGAMGNGDLTSVNPRPVTTTDPSDTAPLGGVTQLQYSEYHVCARLNTGQARCWGYGEYGSIGNGRTDYYNPLTARVLV